MKATLALSLIIVTLGAALVWQLTITRRVREENTALRAQVNQDSAFLTENERLSNLVAQAAASQPVSREQFQELLRLRGEIGLLHKQKAEIAKLLAGNGLTQGLQSSTRAVSDFFMPNESLTNVGYVTAGAAFQTLAWSWVNCDVPIFLASLSPDYRALLLAEKTESELTTLFRNELSTNTTGYRIVNRTEISEDEVLFSVYVGGKEESLGKFRMKRYANEWKLAGQGN